MSKSNPLAVVSSSLLATVTNQNYPTFQPLPINDKLFFDEGPRRLTVKKPSASDKLTSLSNLSSSYAWTQGVEINRQKMYDAGLVKIWSGDAGHRAKPTVLGQDKTFFPDIAYSDTDAIFAIQVLKSKHDKTIWWNFITLPTITGDKGQPRYFGLNGTIEPLTIQFPMSFFTMNVPFEVRSVRGNLMSGNENLVNGSDRVLTVDYYEITKHKASFIDDVTIANKKIMNVLFKHEPSSILPFADQKLSRNSLPNGRIEDTLMVESLAQMSGNTDNYVRFDQRSATCGWDYDRNTSIGTDSLPFGGMTY